MKTNTTSRKVRQILKIAGIGADVKGNDYLGTVIIKAPKQLHGGIECLMVGAGLSVLSLGDTLHVQRF